MTKKQKKALKRILVAAALMVVLAVLPLPGAAKALLYLVPYWVVGGDILRKAVLGVKNRQLLDENFLMAVATVGAMLLGEYSEGVAVMLFYQIGELFQSVAVGKSRRSISELMDIRPDSANLEQEDGSVEEVDPEEVPVGSVILVRPGEKVPLDGLVLEGESFLDTSALTGESVPRRAAPGSQVVSGCINQNGLLRVKTTKEFGESTVAKILDLVENSSMKKARVENFITRFAHWYTPSVCISALVLAVLPPLIWGGWSTWVFRALTFLVISCPCALVISVPLTFFGGIGGASRQGILVKGANYLELMGAATVVVFDKTGTLTQGVFEVTHTHPQKLSEQELLEYAALAESWSSHPISQSLRAAAGGLDKSRVTGAEELAGRGVKALVDGKEVAAGNLRLMEELGLEAPECTECGGGTIVHVAVEGAYAGHILISDRIKPGAAEAIKAMKAAGVKKTVMLTGDSRAVADEVAGKLGLDEVHAELLPADKVEWVEKLLAQKPEKEKLAFVGDGINDAPVLSRADLGIAMGALGSDAAIEAADVVLMDDDPAKIALAMKISRKCRRIVYQNIVFALGVKFLCLALGAAGHADMWAAIFADVGVMVLAVLNATRMLSKKI